MNEVFCPRSSRLVPELGLGPKIPEVGFRVSFIQSPAATCHKITTRAESDKREGT